MSDKDLIRQIVREVLSQHRLAPSDPAPAPPRPEPKPKPLSRPVVSADDIRTLSKNTNLIDLPRNAIITPLAQDLVLQRKLTVRWIDAQTPSTSSPAVPICLLYDQKTVAVEEILHAVAAEQLPVCAVEGELAQTIAQTAQDICASRAAGAIILAQEPYFSLCYANKFKGLRASPAGDWKSVPRAIETISANVLVVDYPQRGFYQLRQLVRTFVELRTKANKPGTHQPKIEEKE